MKKRIDDKSATFFVTRAELGKMLAAHKGDIKQACAALVHDNLPSKTWVTTAKVVLVAREQHTIGKVLYTEEREANLQGGTTVSLTDILNEEDHV